MSEATVAPRRMPGMRISNGKFGMWTFLCSDGMGFAGLFGAYVACRWHGMSFGNVTNWWPNPTQVLNINLTAINTFVLILSSVTMVMALSACKRSDRTKTCLWLGATILGGMAFLGVQVYEYKHLFHDGVIPRADNFAATFFSLTGYHGLHVLTGVIYLICIFVGTLRGKYDANNSGPVEIVGLFWHFVDLVWILLFTFIYLLEPLNAGVPG